MIRWIKAQYREVKRFAHEIRQVVLLLARFSRGNLAFFLESELEEILLWAEVAKEVFKEK